MTTKRKHPPIVLELPSGAVGRLTGLKTVENNLMLKVRYNDRSAFVHQRLFVTRKNDARERLADQGVTITSDRDWRVICDSVGEVAHFREAAVIETPGWSDVCFVQPNRRIYVPTGAKRPKVIFERDNAVASAMGTLRGWRKKVAEPLTGQSIPMLAILAGLAAPLLPFGDEDLNFGFEFSGAAAAGKTTCLSLMASTTRHPSNMLNFNATMAGLEDVFTAYNYNSFPIDEANLAQRERSFMKDFAFRMANGTVKLTRHQPRRARYRFIFATTSNVPFNAHLTASDPDSAGAALQRLIPINIPADRDLGVFDFLPDAFDNSGALAAHLRDAMATEHGTAMPGFLQHLVNARAADEPALRTKIDVSVREFEAAAGVAATQRGRSRASSQIGLLYAAGRLAQECRVLPRTWNCLAACLACYRNYQALLPAHTPLLARLLTIAKRPQTLDLRAGKLTSLTDAKVSQHGAFLLSGVRGRVELLITDDLKQAYFGDWQTISTTPEFAAVNLRGASHVGKERKIRLGNERERYICFILPQAIVDQL
jgi:hypothetical protein